MERTIFQVFPMGNGGRWSVQLENRPLLILGDKYSAVREGKARCEAASSHGVFAQLVIHDSAGHFERHYTYESEARFSV